MAFIFFSVLKSSEWFFIAKISPLYHPVMTSRKENIMTIYHSVTELIGRTPLIQLHKLDTGPCSLFLKLENQNPGGSIKDRVALSMINEAERTGQLQPGGTIIEATAGNTGLGLALIAAQKGYSLILVVPDKMSREKIFHLRALGAQVVLTRSDVNKGHPAYYQDYAQRLANERFTSTSSITRPTRWRTAPPRLRNCTSSLTARSTPSWWASAQAVRWAACRRGSPSTLRIRSSSWQTRPDRFSPTRWKPDATTTRAPGWLRVLAKTLFRRWPTLKG
jgi:hypothetical protein